MKLSQIDIIDPHCHFWEPNNKINDWLMASKSALLGSLKPLQKNYLPEQLLSDSGKLQLSKVIHIEASSSPYAKQEVHWIDQLAQQQPLIGAVIGGCDFLSKDYDALLGYYATKPLVKGVRQLLNWDTQSQYTAASRMDDLTNPQWIKHFKQLTKHDLTFDMQISPHQMLDAAMLANTCSEQQIIIQHAGFPIADYHTTWQNGLAALAECDNVAIKLSGFYMIDHHGSTQHMQTIIDQVVDRFGIERCMFASNFPVEKLFISYDTLYQQYYQAVQGYSTTEQQQLFSQNAKRIYNINSI